jgi:hypothetical protein
MHIERNQEKGGTYLFESSWKRPYRVRGVRKILVQYSTTAEMKKSISVAACFRNESGSLSSVRTGSN